MNDVIHLLGSSYSKKMEALTLDFIPDASELRHLKDLPDLKYLGLGNSNIDDEGLRHISVCESLENLNLQCTEITDKGIEILPRLTNLKYLRLKECDHITNHCVRHINKMVKLEDLQIQETNIDQQGLQILELHNLKFICLDIWNDNYTYDFLLDFSRRFPDCEIVAKGKGTFNNGKYDGEWN